MKHELLHLRHIYKQRGSESVLNGADLRIYAGEILFLLGREGSGKTTIAELLTGRILPDQGEIYRNGKRLRLRGRYDANAQGIHYICEKAALFENLSIGENICLRNPVRFGLGGYINKVQMIAEILCDEFDAGFHVRFLVRETILGPYERILLETLRAVYQKAQLVIYDNLMWQLSSEEQGKLVQLFRKLKARDITVMVCSSSQREALMAADRMVFVQYGAVAADYTVESYNAQGAAAVLGSEILKKSNLVQPESITESSRRLFRFHDMDGNLHQIEVARGESIGIFVPSMRKYRELLIKFSDRNWINRENMDSSNPVNTASLIGVASLKNLYNSIFPTLSMAENVTLPAVKGIKPPHAISIQRYQTFLREEVCGLLSIDRERLKEPAHHATRAESAELMLYRLLAQRYAFIVLAGLVDEPNMSLFTMITRFLNDLAARQRNAILLGQNETQLEMLCDRMIQID